MNFFLYHTTELVIINSISVLSLLSYNTLQENNIFLEFLYWVIPQYLIIMYPQEKINLIVFLINLIDFTKFKYKQIDKKYTLSCNKNNVTFIRAIIALQTAICILGADFKSVFPTKFLKQKSYGLGLMDIGVGSYLFNGGLFAHKCKWKSVFYLFFLGILRLVFIKIFSLDVDVCEYGQHSNFYFVLGFVHLFYKLIYYLKNFFYKIKQIRYMNDIKNNYNLKEEKNIFGANNYLGYIILTIFSIFSKLSALDQFILNDTRNNFVQQNKESFYVLIPFASFIMILQNLSTQIFNCNFKMYKLSKYCLLYFLIFLVSSYTELPSRRLGNISFLFYILFSHTLIMIMYYFLGVFTEFRTYQIIDYVGSNMMANFLMTNVMVLGFKQILDFKKEQCNIIMLFYLFVSFVMPAYLFKKKIAM